MDTRDALNEDALRPQALAQLNDVLAREGFEALYGEDRHCYLRHLGSDTVTVLQVNPHPPLTPAETQRRTAVNAYLDTCSEDELIEDVLLPLFRQLGLPHHRCRPQRQSAGIRQRHLDALHPCPPSISSTSAFKPRKANSTPPESPRPATPT